MKSYNTLILILIFFFLFIVAYVVVFIRWIFFLALNKKKIPRRIACYGMKRWAHTKEILDNNDLSKKVECGSTLFIHKAQIHWWNVGPALFSKSKTILKGLCYVCFLYILFVFMSTPREMKDFTVWLESNRRVAYLLPSI